MKLVALTLLSFCGFASSAFLAGLQGQAATFESFTDELLPLQAVNIHIDVRGWAAAVTAELNYSNTGGSLTDCEFVFPIDNNAAVYHMEAVYGGRRITGRLKTKRAARRILARAAETKQGSVYLGNYKEMPDVLRLAVGNLSPGQNVTVKIGYAQSLERDPYDASLLSMVLPVVLTPRYEPGNDSANTLITWQPYATVSTIDYTMSFTANISMGEFGEIARIRSRSRQDWLVTEVTPDKKSASVRLMAHFIQDHDFGFSIQMASSSRRPEIFVEYGIRVPGKKSWLSYDVVATWLDSSALMSPNPQDRRSVSNEYWLIIDNSGSMQSLRRIEMARSVAMNFVKSLPYGCKFNMISFGSMFTYLFNRPMPFRNNTLLLGQKFVESLAADMGGTEVLAPLQHFYNQATSNNTRRSIIFITDGSVSNTGDVIALVSKNAAKARIFALAVGSGGGRTLVEGMARASDGLAYAIQNENKANELVTRMFDFSYGPIVDNVSLQFSVTNGRASLVRRVPEVIQTRAWSGQRISHYDIIERSSGGFGDSVDLSFTQSASVDGVPFTSARTIKYDDSTYSDPSDPLPIHRLAAKALLQEWSDIYALRDRSPLVKRNAARVSLETGVLSEFTAFVAVNKAGRPASFQTDVKVVNGMAPIDPIVKISHSQIVCPILEPYPNATRLSELQDFLGFWTFSDRLAAAVHSHRFSTMESLKNRTESAISSRRSAQLDEISTATILALAVLRHNSGISQSQEWELVERKAVAYLLSNRALLDRGTIDLLTFAVYDNIVRC